MELQELPKALRQRCTALGIDPETIDDIVSDTPDPGGEWILKVNSTLPYATVGTEYEQHASYQDALDHSLEATLSVKVLKAFDKRGRALSYDATSLPVDPTSVLLLLAPESILDSIPALGELSLVAPDTIDSFVEVRSKTKYVATPAANWDKPITTEEPIKFAGRYHDKVIFTAPTAFLIDKNWQKQIHRIMVAAFKAGEVKEGVRPVLLPDLVKVCRLVVEVGQAAKMKFASGKEKGII